MTTVSGLGMGGTKKGEQESPRTLSVGHMASMNTVTVLHTAAVAAASMARARPQDGSAVWPAAVVVAASGWPTE